MGAECAAAGWAAHSLLIEVLAPRRVGASVTSPDLPDARWLEPISRHRKGRKPTGSGQAWISGELHSVQRRRRLWKRVRHRAVGVVGLGFGDDLPRRAVGRDGHQDVVQVLLGHRL